MVVVVVVVVDVVTRVFDFFIDVFETASAN